MAARLKSYAQIAGRLDIESVCLEPWCIAGSERAHTNGFVAVGTVHWAERHVVKAGLRRFLGLVAIHMLPPEQYGWPMWMRLYEENRIVLTLARQLQTNLPRKLFDKDRARCRFYLGQAWDRDKRIYADEYRRATRWAARS